MKKLIMLIIVIIISTLIQFNVFGLKTLINKTYNKVLNEIGITQMLDQIENMPID